MLVWTHRCLLYSKLLLFSIHTERWLMALKLWSIVEIVLWWDWEQCCINIQPFCWFITAPFFFLFIRSNYWIVFADIYEYESTLLQERVTELSGHNQNMDFIRIMYPKVFFSLFYFTIRITIFETTHLLSNLFSNAKLNEHIRKMKDVNKNKSTTKK